MKVKVFKEQDEAVRYAHLCQQGGSNVSLIIKTTGFVVCEQKDEDSYSGGASHVEKFNASNNE